MIEYQIIHANGPYEINSLIKRELGWKLLGPVQTCLNGSGTVFFTATLYKGKDNEETI